MDKVKLTMVIEKDLVDAAKSAAARQRISLTHLVRQYLMSLLEEMSDEGIKRSR